jgi:type I restriction enzyme R subunit
LLSELTEVIRETTDYTAELGFQIADLTEAKDGFDETVAINEAKEAINQNDKTRKQYELLTNNISKKFKACVNISEAYRYKKTVNAFEIISKRLKDDKKKKDLSAYLFELQKVIDDTITVETETAIAEDGKIYDISQIDFERLKEEFKKSERKNTTVQALKEVIEKRVEMMLKRNPSRKNLYERFQKIVDEYNEETDRQRIEMTFDELLALVKTLDDEDKRAMREELNEETLSLFDLLVRDKPALTAKEIKKLKSVSKELLANLKNRYLNIQNWRDSVFVKGDVESFIHDFLYADETGLPPESFTADEVKVKTDEIFGYIYQQYPNTESFSQLV